MTMPELVSIVLPTYNRAPMIQPAIQSSLDQSYANPEIGLVYCDCQIVNSQGDLLRLSRREPPAVISQKNCVGACFMYRRSVAEKVGEYDRETFLAEDYDYWLRISKVAPLAHLP